MKICWPPWRETGIRGWLRQERQKLELLSEICQCFIKLKNEMFCVIITIFCNSSLSISLSLYISIYTYHIQQDYIYNGMFSSHQQKIIFCYRLGILEFKSRYSHKYSNTKCIYRQCEGGEDSLDHALGCAWNRVEKPRNTNNLGDILKFLEALNVERMEKVGIPLYHMWGQTGLGERVERGEARREETVKSQIFPAVHVSNIRNPQLIWFVRK